MTGKIKVKGNVGGLRVGTVKDEKIDMKMADHARYQARRVTQAL